MKVIHNTQDELVVRSSIPFAVIWAVILFLVFAGAGILAIFDGNIFEGLGCLILAALPGYYVWRDARIDIARLNRPEETLEISRLSLMGYERVRHPLGDLSHAFVDQLQWGKERRSRVVLYLDQGMDEGQHPLMSNHMIATRANQASDTINTWLREQVDSANRPA
ncbi:MAG: hypothetical protein AAFQ09_12035 [Pseudomonadota bacterium]